MTRAALILLALAPAACTTPQIQTKRWFGPVTPTTPGATCTPSKAMLQLKATDVTFAPDEGTWILTGTRSPDGSIVASRTQVGANKLQFEARLTANQTPDGITGVYTTPRCSFTVVLTPR